MLNNGHCQVCKIVLNLYEHIKYSYERLWAELGKTVVLYCTSCWAFREPIDKQMPALLSPVSKKYLARELLPCHSQKKKISQISRLASLTFFALLPLEEMNSVYCLTCHRYHQAVHQTTRGSDNF